MERVNMVKSVSRALDIINIVSMKKTGCGVTEIANQIDINKSSVYRILTTLEKYGYIEQDLDSEKYKLGYQFLDISSRLLESIDLRTEAKPFLEELESQTNEVIHLVVYDEGEVVYLEKMEGTETLRMHSKVGRRAPMHCTAVGKVILSYLPDTKVLEVIDTKGLPKHTDRTIVDPALFLEELKKVRQQGYALDLEENENGITCIGAPIFDNTENVVAAFSISGTTMRMTEERLAELKVTIIDVGKKISMRLGSRQSQVV
ncbi:IclR family transcriptional regulator [Alkalihalobacillus sp. AL-G]|uniref:IclR family transcriptional regulator n=1 Tax=Alkalihalobacillus sp. AL-G TaxID=2926399 RepID=UPI00272B477C|nr:IclR family transcriptional regulator [Alkalihalobacillus sp. AL-G]WLD94452.1 IclR family transcriptional regulator [Alkalihalobacillus sp. AL-G]